MYAHTCTPQTWVIQYIECTIVTYVSDVGRLFLQAEDSLHDLLIPSYKDHLIAAVQCYLIAIEVLSTSKVFC